MGIRLLWDGLAAPARSDRASGAAQSHFLGTLFYILVRP